jgi:hypothetical protein
VFKDYASFVMNFATLWSPAAVHFNNFMFRSSGGANPVALRGGNTAVFAASIPHPNNPGVGTKLAAGLRQSFGLDLEVAAAGTARVYDSGVLLANYPTAAIASVVPDMWVARGNNSSSHLNGVGLFLISTSPLSVREHLAVYDCFDKNPMDWKS